MPNKYVSAQYLLNDPLGPNAIRAIGDDGVAYTISSPDSEISPWPEYLAEGGTIAPADPDDATSANIVNAPDTLTGGPTIKEVFHGN